MIDPHARAVGCPQQPFGQRRRKDIAREFRQLTAAVFQQAFVRQYPGMIGQLGERDNFIVIIVDHDSRIP